MDRFSSDFLLYIKRATFGEKYQFLQSNAIPFSVSFLMDFQERAFHRLVYLYEKLWILGKMTNFNDSTKMNIFQRNNRF